MYTALKMAQLNFRNGTIYVMIFILSVLCKQQDKCSSLHVSVAVLPGNVATNVVPLNGEVCSSPDLNEPWLSSSVLFCGLEVKSLRVRALDCALMHLAQCMSWLITFSPSLHRFSLFKTILMYLDPACGSLIQSTASQYNGIILWAHTEYLILCIMFS